MLKINNDCISCGFCEEVCPQEIIKLEDNIPTIANESHCIKCAHCEAICPQNALILSRIKSNDKKDIEAKHLDKELAKNFLRSRRSIRNFDTRLAKDKVIQELLDIGRFAETGSNSQGCSFLVIKNQEIFNKVKKMTYDFYKYSKDEKLQIMSKYFESSKKDLVFRTAPMLIIALCNKSNYTLDNNAVYALTYIELLAGSLGLGTCWAGYFERYLKSDDKELRNLLNISDKKRLSGALLFGYPKYKFKSLCARDDLDFEII